MIEDAFASTPRKEKVRAYIGASVIGNKCEAYLALSLRAYPDAKIEPFLERIFRDGHRIEDIVVQDLKAAGIEIIELDPLTGRQWEFSDFEGHVQAHADGLIETEGAGVALCEIKSMNDARFNEFKNMGVKFSHNHYWYQMQLMMGLGQYECCLFIAYNKNNGRYHHQWVDYDELEFEFARARIEGVILGGRERIAKEPSDWRCKGCFKRGGCWEGELPSQRSPRTCGNTLPGPGADFVCLKGCPPGDCRDWVPFEVLPREA